MLAHKYNSRWIRTRPGSDVTRQVYDAEVECVAKWDYYSPFEVFNELVCMNLGRMIGLPIPVGFVLEKEGNLYYASANFNRKHRTTIQIENGEFLSYDTLPLPDANFEQLTIDQPKLACGIAVFDVWVGAIDRQRNNVYFDSDGQIAYVFDYGSAVFFRDGLQHLEQMRGEISWHGGLQAKIRSFDDFSFWNSRIHEIPEYFIRDTFAVAADLGIDVEVAERGCDLLIERREELARIFAANIDRFPKVRIGAINPFTGEADASADSCDVAAGRAVEVVPIG